MAKRPRRGRRMLLLLVLLALAWLLLEMNRFFPGVWPGGGGTTGSKSSPTARPDVPTTSPSLEPARSPTAVEPSTTPPVPPEPEKGEARVVVRAADGAPVPGGDVGFVGRADRQPLEKGSRVLRTEAAADAGFVVRDATGASLVHGVPARDRVWIVAWPAATLPKPAARSGSGRTLEVLDADGKPVPQAKVEVRLPGGKEASLVTGADGRATLPASAGVLLVCVSGPDPTSDVCAYAAPDGAEPVRVRLPAVVSVTTRFVDEDDRALRATAITLRVGRDGSDAKRLDAPEEGFAELRHSATKDVVDTGEAIVEVAGRPPIRVALRDLPATTRVPKGRSVTVAAKDPDGRPLADASVVASWSRSPSGDGEAGDRRLRVEGKTDASGTATLPLPADRAADVVVESDRGTPTSRRLAPTDPSTVEVVVPAGVQVPVVVRGPSDLPARGAQVVLVAAATGSGFPARRTAVADAEGKASLGPIAPGAFEVYAKAPDAAWSSARGTTSTGMAPVVLTLERAFSLHLVVEDPSGVPLAGVRVHSSARAEVAAGVPSAVGPDEAPWVTDANGDLLIPDLPDRPLDLHLSKPGYSDETIARVRPGPATYLATLVPKP